MITNERQYRISKSEAEKFARSIAAAREAGPSRDVHPRIHAAMIEALESELDDLREQLQRYEALKDGRIKARELHSLRDVPILLIEGRIAPGLTQRRLASRLGLPEQQVQRYEATMYSGASLDRLQEVVDALELQIEGRASYS